MNEKNNTIVLDHPIKRGEQLIDSLQLRKPSVGALRGIKMIDLLQMEVSTLAVLLPRISTPTLTAADVNQLDPADLIVIASEVASFFLQKAVREFLSE